MRTIFSAFKLTSNFRVPNRSGFQSDLTAIFRQLCGTRCQTLKALFVRVAVTLVLVAQVPAAQTAEVFPGATWDKASPPEALGWSTEKLKAADDFARSLQTDAYLIVDGGRIVHEYGSTTRATNLHSIRKSVLSVLFGIHSDRGVIDLAKTLGELDISDRGGLSVTEKTATVKQLLQARSGVYHPAAYETQSMAASRPTRESSAPGTRWYYNNWDFNALGTIFRKMTGNTVFEALRNDLTGPLQFQDFSYTFDTKFHYEGVSQHPAYLIRLSARDLARIGLLMAREGRWRTAQIVSKSWVDESTASYSNISSRTGYGYMWWVGIGDLFYQAQFPGKVYAAEGSQGQYMIVDPVRDLVIVHRVNSESSSSRNVNGRQFSELLQKIMEARVATTK